MLRNLTFLILALNSSQAQRQIVLYTGSSLLKTIFECQSCSHEIITVISEQIS